jgi:hypothetical protein
MSCWKISLQSILEIKVRIGHDGDEFELITKMLFKN